MRMSPMIVAGGTMNTLLYEVKDHVARITLNRPDAANALNMEMGLDLMHASIRASEDPGVRSALERALTNRVLSAREALEWGIATRIVPDAELQAEAQTLARQLAAGATRALGAAKRLLHHSLSESLETQMELEAQAIADQARTPHAREGIAAFIAKRPADFR